MKKVYIESVATLLYPSDYPNTDLKKELEILSTQKFRRINRYILLGLCGVFKLPEIKNIVKNSALYIGTKNGCITETVSMLGQIYRDSLLPMPFTFIASSANMASYHIANALGLSGGNYTLSHRYAPFETALEMGYWDIAEGKNGSAIIGCIDEAALPLDAFKEAVEMSEVDEPLEGGYWLALSSDPIAPIAEVIEAKRFKTLAQIEVYLPQEVRIIRDDSFKENSCQRYVGSNSGLEFITVLQEALVENIALVTRIGKHQFSLLIIKNLSVKDYN
jgi:hypothetical protein